MLRGENEFQEKYEDFDPEHFDCAEVSFTDPAKHPELTLKMRR